MKISNMHGTIILPICSHVSSLALELNIAPAFHEQLKYISWATEYINKPKLTKTLIFVNYLHSNIKKKIYIAFYVMRDTWNFVWTFLVFNFKSKPFKTLILKLIFRNWIFWPCQPDWHSKTMYTLPCRSKLAQQCYLAMPIRMA